MPVGHFGSRARQSAAAAEYHWRAVASAAGRDAAEAVTRRRQQVGRAA